MFCYYNKQMLSVLGLVLYDFDANKKCQVSLVVKYTSNFSTILNKHPTFSRKLPFWVSLVLKVKKILSKVHFSDLKGHDVTCFSPVDKGYTMRNTEIGIVVSRWQTTMSGSH